MRADIQQSLQVWLSSPECDQYVTTLCLADDLQASGQISELADELQALRSLTAASDAGPGEEDETTQTLIMINIESLPAEMRANLGAMIEDSDTPHAA